MADLTGTRVLVACTNRCGCPYPCSGGAACRCAALVAEGRADQMKCLSGSHCGCKPCACRPVVAAAAENERFYCRCGPGCTCTPCGA